jgi:hypothetical protein
MVIGDPKEAGKLNLDAPESRAFSPLYTYHEKSGQIVRIRWRYKTAFLDLITKELPVPRRLHVPVDQLPTF